LPPPPFLITRQTTLNSTMFTTSATGSPTNSSVGPLPTPLSFTPQSSQARRVIHSNPNPAAPPITIEKNDNRLPLPMHQPYWLRRPVASRNACPRPG
jgi:hypothetical protein